MLPCDGGGGGVLGVPQPPPAAIARAQATVRTPLRRSMGLEYSEPHTGPARAWITGDPCANEDFGVAGPLRALSCRLQTPMMPGPTDSPDQLAPALADRYVIEREIGKGGMATVYLARDVRHDRAVALKVLRPD